MGFVNDSPKEQKKTFSFVPWNYYTTWRVLVYFWIENGFLLPRQFVLLWVWYECLCFFSCEGNREKYHTDHEFKQTFRSILLRANRFFSDNSSTIFLCLLRFVPCGAGKKKKNNLFFEPNFSGKHEFCFGKNVVSSFTLRSEYHGLKVRLFLNVVLKVVFKFEQFSKDFLNFANCFFRFLC